MLTPGRLFGLTAWLVFAAILTAQAQDRTGPTFSKDIAPIFQRSCQECHRPEQIAPMSLLTYEDARPWAKSIKQQVSTRTMPPFHAHAPIGHFLDDLRLTDEEITLVVQWVDQGSPRGDPADMPHAREWNSEWRIGEPDLTLTFPQPYEIKLNQGNKYVSIDLDYQFPEDVWIQGMEFRPGNPKLVHHANVHLIADDVGLGPTGVRDGIALLDSTPTILGYLPGVGPTVYPEGLAMLIPKGSRMAIEVHYVPVEETAYDQSSIGFRYANGTVNRKPDGHLATPPFLNAFEIEPGEAAFTVIVNREIGEDVLVTGFQVHMHLRGKSYEVRFHYPDNSIDTVFWIPEFDFNWQRGYRLRKPFKAPKGTVVEHIVVFDNSSANPLNPDPTQTVRWGWNTDDEMMVGALWYEVPDPDFSINVVDGIAIPDASSARGARFAVLTVTGLLLLAAFPVWLLIGNTRRKLRSD